MTPKQLAEKEYPDMYHSRVNEWQQRGFIRGYSTRDQSAKSDAIAFAEWCMLMAWVETNTTKVIGGMFIIEHTNYDGVYTLEGVKDVWLRDFTTVSVSDMYDIWEKEFKNKTT